MKFKIAVIGFIILAPFALFWGCGSSTQPLSPANSSVMNINIPPVGAHSEFLPAAQNMILYNLSGSSATVTGSYGPLSASAISGNISFSVHLPTGGVNYNLLSLEILNNATQLALAVGAAANPGGSPVTLGPLNKSYYAVSSLMAGYGYGFESNTLTDVGVATPTTAPGIDVVSNVTSNSLGFELDNPALTGATVAYMGNGNFVNYLYLPASSSFKSSSSLSKQAAIGGGIQPVAAGDVYCVKMKAGGYAWLQITGAGVVDVSGPSFLFRVNTTLPYCGYEQTTADAAGSATSIGTPTPYAPLAFSGSGVFTGADYGIAVYPSTSAATSVFVSDDPMLTSLSNTGTAFVHVLNPALTPITTFATNSSWTQGLAVNSSGTTIYVANTYGFGARGVSMYGLSNLTTGIQVGAGTAPPVPDTPTAALAGEMALPEFVAVAPNGNLFVTDSGTNGIADVLVMGYPTIAEGSAVTYWNGQISTGTGPAGIATDGTTVYIADSSHNQIETYNVNGVSANTWTTDNNPKGAVAFSGPQGIALDAGDGLIFIADTGNNRVVEMTTLGIFKATWGTWGLGPAVAPQTFFSGPTAIAVDGAVPPNVFVADSGNKRVLQFKGL